MTVIIPPAPACFAPSKERNNAILDALDVEHRPEWQPGHGLTHCNQAAEVALEALGVHIPKGLLANKQQEWLASLAGATQGWSEVSEGDAEKNAESGLVTVATLHEEGHGHIAVVRGVHFNEALPGRSQLMVWQAGQSNFSNGPIAAGFGHHLPLVRYFSCLP